MKRKFIPASRHVAAAIRMCVIGTFALSLLIKTTTAQEPSGTAAAGRLQQEEPSKARGGKLVPNRDAVIKEMKTLFDKILPSGEKDGKADKWYSPHLRDILGTQENRDLEALRVRARTSPYDNMFEYCQDPLNLPIPAACPLTAYQPLTGIPICYWHDPVVPDGPQSHRPIRSCFTQSTRPYEELNQLSNFKMCCVREGEDETATSEWIASKYPKGDGWAGLFEYYYPTAALGWENDRTTSLIVDEQKIQQCVKDSNDLMEGPQAEKWVKDAIERNLRTIDPGGASEMASAEQTIRDSIKEVRPKDEKLRFTDSLKSEGLSLRVNLAALDPQQRQTTAKRFCMHPQQFDKLFVPGQDLLALGGGLDVASLDNIPVWSNYCPQGVKLMTNPLESLKLVNIDGTPTNFVAGMQAWLQDPLYCQRMHLQSNPNMSMGGPAKAALDSTKGGGGDVGYTCLQGGKLNGSMVPVELYRHAAVERRAAIADHALGFLIAGGIAPEMIQGKKSYYKRFEPQPYSRSSQFFFYKTFIGTRFEGGGQNELGQTCDSLSGENLRGRNQSDRLYISDVTNQAFDQEIVENKKMSGGKDGFDRYRQEWGKDPETGQKIGTRGLDKESQNYAAPFRIFATCPAGFKRWRPPIDIHNVWLRANLEWHCREENFGGPP